MLVRDLINRLEELDKNDTCEEFGPAEIMIDVFELVDDHKFVYRGFSKDIRIERSDDGVYPILTAFVEK